MPVQRCIRHKERNVLDHLPERDRPAVKRRLRAAWKLTDHAAARDRLGVLAAELERSHPGAAASLREGLEETLTLQRLGIAGQLWKTLSSTNPIESMIETVRATSRNVKRWQNGDMCLRWTAAGMLEAPVPTDHRLQASRRPRCRRRAPHHHRTRRHHHPHHPDARARRLRRLRQFTHDRRPKFHGERDTLGYAVRRSLREPLPQLSRGRVTV